MPSRRLIAAGAALAAMLRSGTALAAPTGPFKQVAQFDHQETETV